MQLARQNPVVFACGAALCVLLAACGGGGGEDMGSGLTPFPTETTDELPPGTRIDVSAKNLFQMAQGDFWSYSVLDAGGNPTFAFASRQVTADDGAGHVTLVDNDGGASTTDYVVSADGLLDTHPLGATSAAMSNIVGGIFEYATPLYPVGAQRRHVRSGPWGEDLDGDGIGESFRYEYTQEFLGFETAQVSTSSFLAGVAHFHNVFKLTLRPTAPGNTDYTATATEDAWFAPGLGMVKAQRAVVDSDGVTLDPPHTLLFRQGIVAGLYQDFTAPPVALDGSYIDVALTHNAIVYDSVRNVYYASVPGSVVGNGNRIATIDPTTGHASYSAPVGSEPNALALAADTSVLYVGLDGSGEVVRLALPSMSEQGRVQLPVDPNLGPTHARGLAVSPADPTVVAVSTAPGSPFGTALLRDMVLQPQRTSFTHQNDLLAFDAAGTTLYGLENTSSLYAMTRMQVLADGLAEQLVVGAETGFEARSLLLVNDHIVAGNAVFQANLDAQGRVSGAVDCVPRRAGGLLLCLGTQDSLTGQSHILLADPDTFVIKASLLFIANEPYSVPRRVLEGPAGQVAVSYPVNTSGYISRIRLFSSVQILTPPTPAPVVWPVTAFTTPDGQTVDIGITHNALVYDGVRNVYYASVPGSVIGSGNSIAVIDPVTGEATHSPPIGSEPNALALAADASALYVGLDGSGEVARLALPSMTVQGRVRLLRDFAGRWVAAALAVSPTDPTVAAVSMRSNTASGTFSTGLLRDMVLQSERAPGGYNPVALAFDASGGTLYQFAFGILRQIQVLVNGVTEQAFASNGLAGPSLAFVNNLVIAGATGFDVSGLAVAGTVSRTSDCLAAGGGTLLLCLTAVNPFAPVPPQVLVADPTTFAIGQSLLVSPVPEPYPLVRRFVLGPSGQVAINYVPALSTPMVRLFTSAQLP